MAAILECRNLIKVFRKFGRVIRAVDGVCLSIQKGESFGLVGGSGCGKSTLARVIARLIDSDSGHVFLDGLEITQLKGRDLRQCYRDIQMVFQDPLASFDPRQTIARSLMEVLTNFQLVPKAGRREALLKALDTVGLPEGLADRLPGQLSGGQCQRAAIARAVLVKPKLLICDEATSALDAIVQAQILRLLQKLSEDMNLTTLFISHDLALVRAFCERVGVMHDGKLLEVGSASDIIEHPQHPYTKALLSSLFTLP